MSHQHTTTKPPGKYAQRKWWIAGIMSLLILAATTFVLHISHADWQVAKTIGIDKWESHKPFFGNTAVRQQFTADSETLSRIDVLIVDFKKKASGIPIVLTVEDDELGRAVREVSMPGSEVRDDYYLPFRFDPLYSTKGKMFSFTVAAPQATSQEPYAVRLTNDGNIAFSYYRSTTKLYLVQQWLLRHRKQVTTFSLTLILGILALYLVPRAADRSGRHIRLLVIIVIILGVILQVHILRFLSGDTGGDAYYYLVAAHQLARGENPLAFKSFRLPFFPVLLIPAALPSIPDILWGRIVGVATTVGIAGALILLATSMGFRPLVGIMAMAILYFNTDFLMTTVRPRPHTLYAFLLLLSMALFFRLRTVKQAFVLGVVLGIMGMTRQEAFLPIAIIGIALLITLIARRLSFIIIIRYLAAVSIPLLIIVSPYLYANYTQHGNPFDSAYFHKTDTPQARSIRSFFLENGNIARDKLTSAWLPSSEAGMRPGSHRQFLSIFTVAFLIYIAQRTVAHNKQRFLHILRTWYIIDTFSIIATLLLIVALLRWSFFGTKDWSQEINMVLLAAAALGAIELIRVTRWRSAVVIGILLTQLGLAIWYNPIPRLFQQAYPLFAFSMMLVLLPWAGISTTQRHTRPSLSRCRQSLRAAPLAFALGLLGTSSITHLDNAIDALNFPAAPYYVTTSAAERLERYPGKAAAEVDYTIGDGIYRLHSYQQLALERFEEDMTPRGQLQWLCERDIRYVVDHGDLDRFTILDDQSLKNKFQLLFETTAQGWYDRQFRVRVYEFSDRQDCNRTHSAEA